MTQAQLKKTVFYLDGLKYSFAAAEIANQRLRRTLRKIARLVKNKKRHETEVSSALLDAWTIVDMCNRARELIQQTPGLSQKLPEIQIFIRLTEHIKKLRDYFQHFRSGIPAIPSESSPLWGALSWVSSADKTVCYTICSGNVLPGVTAPSCVFDCQEFKFTSNLMLYAHETEVDLPAIADHLRKLKRCVHAWIDRQPSFKRADGNTLIYQTSFRRESEC